MTGPTATTTAIGDSRQVLRQSLNVCDWRSPAHADGEKAGLRNVRDLVKIGHLH